LGERRELFECAALRLRRQLDEEQAITLDSGFGDNIFTRTDFEAALKKVSPVFEVVQALGPVPKDGDRIHFY
jgi:hypothetical protein